MAEQNQESNKINTNVQDDNSNQTAARTGNPLNISNGENNNASDETSDIPVGGHPEQVGVIGNTSQEDTEVDNQKEDLRITEDSSLQAEETDNNMVFTENSKNLNNSTETEEHIGEEGVNGNEVDKTVNENIEVIDDEQTGVKEDIINEKNKDAGHEDLEGKENTSGQPDMLEFEVVGKIEHDSSDPITPEDNMEQDDSNLLGVEVSRIGSKYRKKGTIGKRELKAISAGDFKEETAEYDVFVDSSNRIHRQYRLREAKPVTRTEDTGDTGIRFRKHVKSKRKIKIEVPKTKARRPSIEYVGCSLCNKKFFTKNEARRHYRTVHNTVYTCSLCSQAFQTNKDLISHKKVHDAEQLSFLCHECKLAFSDHCDFLLHELTHAPPSNTFKCNECGLSYTKSGFGVHIYTHFDKPVPCPTCGKLVSNTHNLKSHMRKHEVNTQFECLECGKVMTEKNSFDMHMSIHTGVKLHQCLYCGKAFRTGQQKQVHTRIHTQERPFSCNICDRRFIQSTDLHRHEMRFHGTQGKPECEICKKRFWDMKSHMKMHTGNRWFECTDCDKKYISATGLKAHLRFIHSTARPVKCELCQMNFVGVGHLNRHKMCKKHKNNEYRLTLKKEKDN